MSPSTALTRNDRIRQVVITVSEILCLYGTLLGVGVIGGTRVEESAGGALSAEATLLAPATQAFSIWTPVYLGLFVYTLWQWRPSVAVRPRHRRIGWLVAASMLLNAGWLLVTQQGWLWVSVVVIVALLVSLGVLVARLGTEPAGGWAERLIVDGTFGLYLGWVCVATCANITATLKAEGIDPGAGVQQALAFAVLAVVVVVAVVLAKAYRGRIAVAAAIAWGLSWIAVGRLTDQPSSTIVGITAAVAALIVVAVTLAERLRRAPATVDA